MKLSKRAHEVTNEDLQQGPSEHGPDSGDHSSSEVDQSYHSGNQDDEHTSTGSTTTEQKKDESTSQSSTLARAETILVNRTKTLVLFVLFLAAVGVGAATFLFAKNSEQKEFESKFHDFAIEIEALVHHEAKNVFRSVKALSTAITSYALSTQSKMPFFTLPHFENRGIELNVLSRSLLTAYSPLVQQQFQEQWELYSMHMQGWIQEGVDHNIELHQGYLAPNEKVKPISPVLFRYLDSAKSNGDPSENRTAVRESGEGPFLPVWQMAPAPHDPAIINYNLLDNAVFRRIFGGMTRFNSPVLSEATQLDWLYGGSIRSTPTHPYSFLLQPVYDNFAKTNNEANDYENNHRAVVGTVISIIPWDHYFENLLQPEAHGIHVVMKDTCGDAFTYLINGPESIFVGWGDLHDRDYSYLEESSMFDPLTRLNASDTHDHCEYDLHIFPSDELKADFMTNKPIIYTAVVMMVFFCTTMVFVLYDFYVNLRQEKVMLTAKRSNAVVASLFPKNVRERIMKDMEEQINAEVNNGKTNRKAFLFGAVAKNELKNFLNDGVANADGVAFDTKPIADLFPNTTIMFADICGFTAWSSVREPTQVFQLLETLYHSFDEIAKRRRVFKVETIGDCYVAVAGLPEPRKDHASVMARFSRDCLSAMNDLTKKLEVTLGPDTGDLNMRCGLHSGPVTAGVLRGDKSRFQLFGDTVNTAARMESNGIPNKIHVSLETAELLRKAGKPHWLVKREDKVLAKGKGELETYWLDLKQQSCSSHHSGKSGSSGNSSVNAESMHNKTNVPQEVPIDQSVSPKIKRLVRWNADVLLRLLKQVVARREAQAQVNGGNDNCSDSSSSEFKRPCAPGEKTVLDEVKEVIPLPHFDPRVAKVQKDPKEVQLDAKVVQQLHDYITVIATMYREEVPFHNFSHASHVTMSVTKLLSRIVAPEEILMAEADGGQEDDEILKNVHDHTYGITSDPLTQFAVVLSALIHDVDHTGVPNTQLVKEGASIAAIYNGKSVAEQNSVDIAFDLLMDESFDDLRKTIYATDEERKRFRQLVVNVVLATDIVDKELKELRNARWAKAFTKKDGDKCLEPLSSEDVNRKATIVLEHLIQASDVAHTMQHWHIYRKWNEAFFQENLLAYHQGRSEKNPADFWAKGEIGFFDFYIIPLARKLKECGVFGVSCDEYLNYALSNRKEWEARGAEITAEMVEKYNLTMAKQAKEFAPIEEFSEEMGDDTDSRDQISA